MKYDLSQIMKDAWKIVKKAGKNFSEALKMAWRLAKALVEVRKDDCEEDGTIEVSFWFNYGKARAYFTRSYVSIYQNKKRFYIDLETGLKRL